MSAARRAPISERRIKAVESPPIAKDIGELLECSGNDHLYVSAMRGINELVGLIHELAGDQLHAGKITREQNDTYVRRASGSAYDAISAILANHAGEKAQEEMLREIWIRAKQGEAAQ